MDKFWNCWIEDTTDGFHYKHPTLEEAKQEAERLQRMPSNRDKRVYIMELICYCEILELTPPIAWHTVLGKEVIMKQDKAITTAWEAWDKTIATAEEAYEKAIAPAREAYEKATATAREAYRKARATAERR